MKTRVIQIVVPIERRHQLFKKKDNRLVEESFYLARNEWRCEVLVPAMSRMSKISSCYESESYSSSIDCITTPFSRIAFDCGPFV